MQDNSRLNMKKNFSKLALGLFLLTSMFCLVYLNQVEQQEEIATTKYEQLAQSTDKVMTSVKTATVVFEKVVDFLTNREV